MQQEHREEDKFLQNEQGVAARYETSCEQLNPCPAQGGLMCLFYQYKAWRKLAPGGVWVPGKWTRASRWHLAEGMRATLQEGD